MATAVASTGAHRYRRVIATGPHRSDHRLTEPTGMDRLGSRSARHEPGTMDLQRKSMEQPVEASLKTTYRALLARGLEAGRSGESHRVPPRPPERRVPLDAAGGRGDRPAPA